MKNLLPALLWGFCTALGAAAQEKPALTLGTLKPTQALTPTRQTVSPVRPLTTPARVADKQRSHKMLAYMADGKEFGRDWTLGAVLTSFDDLHATHTGYGFAHLFAPDLVKRYAGNTITSINFYCCGAKFSNGRAFIIDYSAQNMVWMAQDFTITPTTFEKGYKWQLNSVPCDYTITGDEGALLIGWVADAEEDPAFPYNDRGICVPIYNDPTNAGLGCYIVGMKNDESRSLDILRTDPLFYDYYGNLSKMCTYLTVDTDGDASIGDNDASVTGATNVRGAIGSDTPVYSTLSLTNMGLDPIKSISYVCEIDGQTKEQTVNLTTPITYYKEGKVRVPVMVASADEGTLGGTVTVTKVNGQDDAYDSDNSADYNAVSMRTGYKRVPAVEMFTSTTSGDAPLGYAALAKAQEANADMVPINVHVDYQSSLAADPFVTSSYNSIVAVYATRFPSALVNRETKDGFTYGEMADVTGQVASGICEADLTLDAPKLAAGATSIDVKANVNFKFDVQDSQYGIAYVFTEDGLSAEQLSTPAAEVAALRSNNPGMTADQAMEQLGFTDPVTRASVTDAQADADGNYWYTTTLNDVACSISQSVGYDNLLPAADAGHTVTVSSKLQLPQRVSPAINVNNLKLAALLIDQTSGVVVTAKQFKLSEGTTGIGETATAQGKVDIQLADGAFVVKADHAEAQVYSADGRLVSSATVNGEASLPTFGHGAYVIRVTSDGKVTSQKAVF